MASQKRLLLGITGGIAAYKTVELVRRLKESHYDVQVVMTKSAQQFVAPLALQAVSGRTVRTELFDPAAEMAMGHIELARWAEQILIAPASADIIAKLAHGFADDLLTTLCLAARAPIWVAPAMNQAMWHHPATQSNLAILSQRDVTIILPTSGEQACGDIGIGRMPEPLQLITALESQNLPTLKGLRILISAGATQEPIDPVRFISNRSSGKMGYALAAVASRNGAEVTLISGCTTIPVPSGVQFFKVTTALEMYDAVLKYCATADIFISTAAVADYRCESPAAQKIKKSSDTLTLTLTKNPDILKTVSALPKHPFLVGFSAETERVIEQGRAKLIDKQLDLIAINDVSQPDIGFDQPDNALTVLSRNQIHTLAKAPKIGIAQQLLTLISAEFKHH